LWWARNAGRNVPGLSASASMSPAHHHSACFGHRPGEPSSRAPRRRYCSF
jgi:hypothetical protein